MKSFISSNKKSFILSISFLLMFFGFINVSNAQTLPVTEEQVLEELQSRGISEEEATMLLEKEGIDIDDLENMSPQDILRLQSVLEEYQLSKSKAIVDTIKIELDTIPVITEEVDPEMEDKEELVEEEEIEEFEIYGQSLFAKSGSSIFDNGSNFTAPDSYILGISDKVAISIFGNSQIEETYEINKEGYIRILPGGSVRVLLKGLSLGEAKSKLRKIYREYYDFRTGEFEVALRAYREVQVNVFGEAKSIGTFNVPASNSAFNVLAAVGGPNKNGTLRRIQLIKADGGNQVFDVYAFLSNPGMASSFYLSNNDVVHIPNQGNIVDLKGAVKRPLKYEMLDFERLSDLIEYAGGFTDNAIKGSAQVIRYVNNDRVILDADINSNNIVLLNGDEVLIREVNDDLTNVVEVSGEVEEEGFFELTNGMKLDDLAKRAGLKPESYLSKVVLKRMNFDSTSILEFIDLSEILNNPKSNQNFLLKKNDKLVVWPKSRFSDNATISIDGAVREAGEFPFDSAKKLTVKEAVILAGGLRTDAGNLAIIHRKDPLLENQKKYITVFLDKLSDSNNGQNVSLEPFDRLEILSENYFDQETKITIEGAVNNPGDFQYGKDMKVMDAITLARGFRLGAQTDNIEISRVIIQDNKPTETVVATLKMNKNFDKELSGDAAYVLQPFDRIYVRYVPDFELQQNVKIQGEIRLPGPYSILSENETISSIVKRAGGLTKEAFPEGAKLLRQTGEERGYVVMRLEEVLKNKNSRYNYILKDGDIIEIPKQKDFVTIKGFTRVREVVADETIGAGNEIKVAYHKGKNAKFYVDYYAGGIADEGSRKKIFVEHANGEVKHTKRRFIFGTSYPEVKKGSVISVGMKTKKSKEDREREDVNWTKVIGDTVAQAVSILSLLLLAQSVR